MDNRATLLEQAKSKFGQRLAFLDADPENLSLLAECADLALQLGKAADASRFVERGLMLRPDDPYLKSRLATAKLAGGDAAGAIEIFEGLIKTGHGDPALRYNLAYALMLSGQHAEAKEQLEQAKGLPQAELLRVRAHHHLGEVDEAIKVAEEFATANPEDAEVSAQLGMLYLDNDDFTKARAWTEKALALPQKMPEAYFTAGFLALGDEDEDKATELLDRAIELQPKSGRAWAGKGLTSMLRGELAGGEEALTRAVQYMPTHIGTWHALAWCQILLGKLDAAEASFRKAYDLDRSFGETHGGLAMIELLRGEGNRAQRRANTALRLDPDTFAGRYALLLLEAKTEDARAEGVRKILASQRALRGGTLLDMLARYANRRPNRRQ